MTTKLAIGTGDCAAVAHTVGEEDTALALHSGDMAVLATSRLIAWCEEASVAAIQLGDANTSVGTRVKFDHLAASPVGEDVRGTATVTHVDGRLVKFEVVAHDSAGHVIGHGEVQRVVVERKRFLARLER